MRAPVIATLGASLVMLGCSATIPEGQLECDDVADCPEGWACVSSLCWSDEPLDDGAAGPLPDGGGAVDGGADAGPDVDANADGAAPQDAGGADAGDTVPDAGPALGEPAQVTAGDAHSCVRYSGGRVFCWGNDQAGQLGDGTTAPTRTMAVEVRGLTAPLDDVEAGSAFTCALTRDEGVWCWGANDHGQLGDGSGATLSVTPVAVDLPSPPTALAVGSFHACAALEDGTVHCWGRNDTGQLGDGTTEARDMPVRAGEPTGAVAVAAGRDHTCVLDGAGAIACFGANGSGQLGTTAVSTGWGAKSTTPVAVDGIADATLVSVGGHHSCALRPSGLWCWGLNNVGQLGLDDRMQRDVPTALPLEGASQVTQAGSVWASHTCAVGPGLGPRCWGSNAVGQLGDGTTTTRLTPTPVTGLARASSMAAGAAHSCAITAGRVRCWGHNEHGQLGNLTTTDSTTAVDVQGLPD